MLRDAEALVTATLTVPAPKPSLEAGDAPLTLAPGSLHTHSGLKKAVNLLTYLARVLPNADVQWRIEKRLLGSEPFVDFEGSDVLARAILLNGRLELLATLYCRDLPIDATAAAISGALALMARDTLASMPVLDAIHSGALLPEVDFSIGSWKYDAAMRQRRPLDISSELTPLYGALNIALEEGLKQMTTLIEVVGIKAVSFITSELVQVLLGTEKHPVSLKRLTLSLVCTALNVASPCHDDPVVLHLTGTERAAREAARRSLCFILEKDIIPALELMVHRDYRTWGNDNLSDRARDFDRDASRKVNEHLGSEKVEALGQCYAFMVSCDRLGWPAIEAKATQPYSYHLFWRTANAANRNFAVFLLAHVLAHAPKVLSSPVFATSVLKVWMQSLVDTGGRHSSWYLTNILAKNPGTAALFAGLSSDDLDIRNDRSGAKRAKLVGAVGRKMVGSASWKSQIAGVITDLDAVLASKNKEIETSAFNPATALLKWEAAASEIIISLLDSMAAWLVPPPLAPMNRQQPKDFVVSQLQRLVSRVANWVVSSCAAAHAELARKSATAHIASFGMGSFSDRDTNTGDEFGALKTVADARQRLQASAFAKLPKFFHILTVAGAPDMLEKDAELLEPLWVVIAGCIEIGSGEIIATPVDTAMFEMLGDSLAPTTRDEGVLPRLQLCEYVLTTFVRRYMQRSSLRHASHERAAVNAVRLVRAVLAQPSIRNSMTLQAALRGLLRPILAVLSPEGGVQPSFGTKGVIYT